MAHTHKLRKRDLGIARAWGGQGSDAETSSASRRVGDQMAGLDSGWSVRSFVAAATGLLIGLPNPLEIARMRTAGTDRVVEAITEAVRQDGVVHGFLPALSLGEREVLVGRHPVAQLVSDRLEVARPSKLLRAEALGHLACELRDVTLLGCPYEDSLRAEPLQLGCNHSAAFRIQLNPRHEPTLLLFAQSESRTLGRPAIARTRYRVEAIGRETARRGRLQQGPLVRRASGGEQRSPRRTGARCAARAFPRSASTCSCSPRATPAAAGTHTRRA